MNLASLERKHGYKINNKISLSLSLSLISLTSIDIYEELEW